jgi:hypothetical protein
MNILKNHTGVDARVYTARFFYLLASGFVFGSTVATQQLRQIL